MTAVCVGGAASGPKPGVAETIIYGAGALATIFEKSRNFWLLAAAPLLGVISYDAISLCAVDPPAVTALTDAEVNAVLGLQLGPTFLSGLAKIKDLALNAIWYDLCQCTTGAQPTPPAPLPAPANTTQAGATASCGSASSPLVTWTSTNDVQSLIGTVDNVGNLVAGVPLPTGFTSMEVHSVSTCPAIPAAVSYQVKYYNAAGVFVAPATNWTEVNGASSTRVSTPGAGVTQYIVLASRNTVANGTYTAQVGVNLSCGGAAANTPASPCCPPDPSIAGMLKQIWDQVNLIQRQAVPFAYLASTAHAGLTGHGNLEISGLVGVAVTVTVNPGNLGQADGTPNVYFDMGFLTFGSEDGYDQSVRLNRLSQVVFPARCSVFTDLGYTLHDGVTVTITELVREP